MITRADIHAVIGGHQTPSCVAMLLDAIRKDDPGGLTEAARMADTRVCHGVGLNFLVCVPRTLARTYAGIWYVAPIRAVSRSEALGGLAILDELRTHGRKHATELHGVHTAASRVPHDIHATCRLLVNMVIDGEVEPVGVDTREWLYGTQNGAGGAHTYQFQATALGDVTCTP